MRSALLCLLLAVPAQAQSLSEVKLAVGEHKVVPLQSMSRIAVGDATIADVKLRGPGQVELIGLHQGRTTLLVWNTSGDRVEVKVTVGHPPAEEAPGPAPAARSTVPPPVAGPGHCAPTTGPANDALEAAKKLVKAKDFEGARKQYVRALTLDPLLGAARLGLGSTLARLSSQEEDSALVAEAGAQYRAYLDSCPDGAEADKVRMILEQFEKAR